VLFILFGWGLLPVRGQEQTVEPLELQRMIPGGVRTTATESSGNYEFTVFNRGSTPREVRVAVFFAGRPDVQYARDVWVPAHASATTWVPVGPAPEQASKGGREIHTLLYDRTGGGNRQVLPPGEARERTRPVPYRKREPTTAVLADPEPEGERYSGREPTSPAVVFTRVIRQGLGYSDHVQIVPSGLLPTYAEGFDGVDVLVLAGNGLAADPAGQTAIRRWVQHGGTLWLHLDRISPELLATLLGDDLDIGFVDRVRLTSIRIAAGEQNPDRSSLREVEEPVEFVRVVPASADRVIHTVNGWPASFVRDLGKGRVVFTTLGPWGWYTPRTARDGRSPFDHFPDLPVGSAASLELGGVLLRPPEKDPLPPEAFGPLLRQEIGYAVIGLETAAAILGGFVFALLGVGIGLRRSRRPELIGWVGPAAAVAAGALLVGLGERSRRAVPPTVATAELVVPAGEEAAITGLFAVYQPASGPIAIGSREGAALELDAAGLEGKTRRRVQSDSDVWEWEGLSLPAGIRTGSFRCTRRVDRMQATGRFGPDGFEGRLAAGPYTNLADAVIVTAAHEPVAVRLGLDVGFAVGTGDALPAGAYLAGSILSDRQQQRQEVYRQLLSGPLPPYLRNRNALLAWADAPGVPFIAAGDGRVVATALLALPLEYEPSPSDSSVVVPRGFIPYRRILDGRSTAPTMSGASSPLDMRLRFQLPSSILPFHGGRATLVARVRAPWRQVAVAGVGDGGPIPLYEMVGPVEPIRIEIADERALRTDSGGGLLLDLVIGAPMTPGGNSDESEWVIESLGLEVVGRTGPAR